MQYRRLLSSRSLIGTKVCNADGETLGRIEEIMINTHTGNVGYLVLSFGGFLGIGDKLFAVPFESVNVDQYHEHVRLNVDRDRLETAPGFDKDNWPDFADQSFQSKINNYYDNAW